MKKAKHASKGRTEKTDRSATQKKRRRLKMSSSQKKTIAVVLALLIALFAFYGVPIIKLKVENAKLIKQQQELEEQKSAKTKELKNVHSKDYIQEQARKKLRLLNKDETMFIFEGDENNEEDN